jgi:hypothetical protein
VAKTITETQNTKQKEPSMVTNERKKVYGYWVLEMKTLKRPHQDWMKTMRWCLQPTITRGVQSVG